MDFSHWEPSPYTRWTIDDVLWVHHVAALSLANTFEPTRAHRFRLFHTEDMLPTYYDPKLRGHQFAAIPGCGALLALITFYVRCHRDRADVEWCRWVFREAGIEPSDLLTAIEPLTHLYESVRDVPGQIFQQDPSYYRLVPVSDLPYGQSMHSCGHKELVAVEYSKIARRARWAQTLLRRPRNFPVEETRAGRRLIEAIRQGTIAPCENHQDDIDWTRLNAIAEQIRTTTRPWTRSNVEAAAHAVTDLSAAESETLRRLFTDPIRWQPGQPQVGGGQHRICGYRVAGATHAFVAVGPEH